MKKLITAMLALAAIAPLSAQQLPNNGFEEDWVQFTPWKTGTTKTSKNCVTPPGWTVADVASPTEFIVGEKIANGYKGTSSVKIINKFVEIKFLGIEQYVPGYITLGTPWSTSMGMKPVTDKDGGTFGGLDFAYTPDALSFAYKAEVNPGSIVAYMWNGTYEQNNVPGEVVLSGSPKTATMIDRDRQILKEAWTEVWTSSLKGDNPTQFGTLVASCKGRPEVSADWKEYTIDFEYKSETEAPEKINVIFSAGDYFTQPGSADKDNTMSVDDVKLLYYSRLKTLLVNGTEVTLEKDKYDYDLSESVYMPKSAEEISYTLHGTSPAKTVDIALDAENNTATITVKNTNEGAQDIDGKSEHVYTIKFKVPRTFTGIEYPGQITLLTMDMGGGPMDLLGGGTADASVWMTQKGTKRIIDVLLPDFTLPGLGTIGDILVENVKRTYNNNNGNPIYDYTGNVDDLSLGGGGIHAVVDLEGTSDVDGNVNFKIHVQWIYNYDELHAQSIVAREAVEPIYYPIEVEFNGKTATPEVPTGINDVTVDGSDAPVEYFDLQGIRVSNPQAGRMVIRRQGTNVEKILVK